MKLLKPNFINFLQKRLKPDSSESYLDYVEAFQRAIKKEDAFLFNGQKSTKEYLKKFLNREAHPPALRELSKKYKDNIRTGIRSLLLYYQFEEENTLRRKENRSELVTLTLENLTNEYEFWLTNRYLKQNGEKFKSGKAYASYIKSACLDNETNFVDFVKIRKSKDLENFIQSLKKSENFKKRTKHTQQSILSSFNKYEVFINELYGEKQKELYLA